MQPSQQQRDKVIKSEAGTAAVKTNKRPSSLHDADTILKIQKACQKKKSCNKIKDMQF